MESRHPAPNLSTPTSQGKISPLVPKGELLIVTKSVASTKIKNKQAHVQ